MTPGTYILLLHLRRETTIQIGRLGPHRFETGYYAYAGSALSGLEGRIDRHLRSEKAKRWHIDYLREVTTVQGVWVLPGTEQGECSLAAELLRMAGAQPGPRGFGSSDCRCRTHLVHFRDQPPMDSIEQRWGLPHEAGAAHFLERLSVASTLEPGISCNLRPCKGGR